MKYTVNIHLTKTLDHLGELSFMADYLIPHIIEGNGFVVENMQVSRQYDAPTMLGSAQAISAAETMTAPASTAVDQPAAEPVKRTRTKKAEAAPAEVSSAKHEKKGPFYWSHPESSSQGVAQTLEELRAVLESDPCCEEVSEEQYRKLLDAEQSFQPDTSAPNVQPTTESQPSEPPTSAERQESTEEATATIEEVRAYANLRIKGDAAQGVEADNGFGAKVAEVLKNQFGVKALSDVADKTKPSPKFAQVLAALKEVK